MTNIYVFEKFSDKANKNAIRCISLEEDENGCKSVTNIHEMYHDGSFESLKHIVKCLFNMNYVGEQYDDLEYGYQVRVANKDYDASLEGKARKRTSKEINVISAQLFG
jgi:lipid A disaccharide synthetase